MHRLIAVIFCLISTASLAAPGKIFQAPVIEATGVKPNIMLILDDSGSMNWEDTLNKGVEKLKLHKDIKLEPTSSYVSELLIYRKYLDMWQINKIDQDIKIDKKKIKKEQANAYMNLATCPGFNVLAYNENKIYAVPPGRDEVSDHQISQVSNLFYYRWGDRDTDGEYDIGECGLEWRPDDDDYDFDDDYLQEVKNLDKQAQKNYANWFYFYRDRMKVAQFALSKVISFGNARVGFNTLHKRNEQDVSDVDKDNHRQNLINAVIDSVPSGGTPLRTTLQRVGEYFKLTGNEAPILTAEEGGMCQQNYAILMSDGYWNGKKPKDVKHQDKEVGGLVRKSDKDKHSDTLADVAMKYYKEDLRSDLDNMMPIVRGVDENPAQHLVTYTIGFGVNGKLSDNPPDPDSEFIWPEPKENTQTTIDDMRHAAWNSRGEFLSAADPEALDKALNNIVSNINARSTSTSSLEVASNTSTNDRLLVQATYDPSSWKGDVITRYFDGMEELNDTKWSLSQWLRELDKRHVRRRILTINPQASTDSAFAFSKANIDKFSDIQQQDLDGLVQASPAELIDYLKGDAQYEGSKFRARHGYYLGDIVGSYPVIIDAPKANYTDVTYASFYRKYAKRTSMTYVGANDGMLHAINLESGEEEFAFIPHGVFSIASEEGVRQLARKDYMHRFYVNATPVARDAYVKLQGENEKEWHTLLLGGLGAGGKSVYLLDITDPDTFAAAAPSDIVKWEFSHDDLGYSFSEIQVAKLVDDNWYAIFGNGYNADNDGKAKLFIVNLEDPDDYTLIDTGVGSISGASCLDSSSDCNGLSSPEIADLDGDGVFDWVYAGDLHGNLWTFDLTEFNGTASSVSMHRLFLSCATPLLSGECPADVRQPITTRPALARNTHFTGNKAHPYLNVFWGTGQLLSSDDKKDKNKQTFYSVLHRGDGVRRYQSDLVKQSFQEIGGVGNARIVNGKRVEYLDKSSAKFGWYLSLPDEGERLITTPAIRGDLVVFNSIVPGENGPCIAGADGWLNAVNLLDGLTPVRVGNDNNNQIFDYNGDSKVNEQDRVGGFTVVGIKMAGEPTAPRLYGDTQYVGLGASQNTPGGVREQLMNFGVNMQAGRSGWFQLR
ncbi:hypothetical protein FGL86_06960 [Pistricoccus aurantiacus]|uniref:PilY1 beta-propeller domain-containing protein n=1 Tax=Pistricoccus aurantiacus TaxID=1883414 RepID=A0A5B8SVS1_9GAMM|nr:PilC/PilY family type IV pilus protein [Pistricoccus aurantiacus]QEA38840.1 hypothetical protein FGL86_06960 [Pistricoccus aurantiacus]